MAKARQTTKAATSTEDEVKKVWMDYKKKGGEARRNRLMER